MKELRNEQFIELLNTFYDSVRLLFYFELLL